MKRLLFVILTAAALYAGYWFIGSNGATAGFERWFEDRRNEGWVAEYDSITTNGFPSRFDTTISDLSLADPETGVAYSAPFLQVFALSYKPEHLIAVWPNEQTISSPFGKAAITSTDMRASLIVKKSASLALEKANYVTEGLVAKMDDGHEYGASKVLMAVERKATELNSYHFGVEARDLILPQPANIRLEAGLLPQTLEFARGDVTASFDAPWDLNALQSARPQPTRIDVKLIEAKWGQLELRIAGGFDVDSTGRADGQITIKAQNWRDILAISAATGLIPKQLVRPIDQALSLLSGLSGNRNTLDLPLALVGGQMKLGPIPLGPAPLFRLR
ncbi:DUF2125 domain-containing protein [Planktotalea sp.]|uniref:DUF2125 domain-containing protein n=1 Tax=Planktotalea sp. TaxID=2029877 RepID=UPI0025E68B51|nr:DUF2125 domain-containing protein [Planktotalea sp.]